MKLRRFVLIFVLLIPAGLLFFASLVLVESTQVYVKASPPGTPEMDITLDLCMSVEPESLYYYTAGQSIEQLAILSAVFDGPVDTISYAYQPVIFESIPTLDNGQAVTHALQVNEGETIVDRDNNVVQLQNGTWYLPGGCYDSSCAVQYSGGWVNMEQMAVTHTLLSDLAWSDGHELTSEDMLYSFSLASAPETPSSKYLIERTSSYITSTLTQTLWTGLPGFFPASYSTIYWTPLPEHVWSQYSPTELITATVSSRTPLGWGAYVIDEWVPGDQILMHKNPLDFRRNEGLPKFNHLMVHFGMETDGILNGVCDVVVNSFDNLAGLIDYDDAGMLELITSPGTVWEHLDFGIQSNDVYTGFAALTGAFQDVRVRQAFASCIDRQALVDSLYFGLTDVPEAFIPAVHPYFPADALLYPYNPAQGNALLNQAGWTDRNGNGIRDKDGFEFSLTLKTTNSSIRYTVASMMAGNLADCGIELTPVHMSPNELFQNWPDGPIFGRKFDLGEFAWLTGVIPPCNLYLGSEIPSNSNPGGQNNTGYANPAYDAACMDALGSLYESHRMTYYSQATRLFTQELPSLPLFLRPKWGLTAPHITGFALDPTESTFYNIEALGIGIRQSIPPEGGILISPQDATSYYFPAGTFTETVVVTHTPLSPVMLPGFGELGGAGHFFTLEATLDGQPVEPLGTYTMTIGYTDAELGIVVEDTLALYYWDGGAWVSEPSAAMDFQQNTITATPDHLSLWAVLGIPYKIQYLPVVTK